MGKVLIICGQHSTFYCHSVRWHTHPWLLTDCPWSRDLPKWPLQQFCTKPLQKIRIATAIFWIYIGIFRDYGLRNIFFGIKLVSFSSCLFSTHSAHATNCYFYFFYRLSDWVEILLCFTKFFFRQLLKVSAFYLEKKKVSSPQFSVTVLVLYAIAMMDIPNLSNFALTFYFLQNILGIFFSGQKLDPFG